MFSFRGGWCPVSHDVQGVLGLCVLRTVGNKVLLSIMLHRTALYE